MTESALKRQCLAYLTSVGGLWLPTKFGDASHSGAAQIIGCFHGEYVAVFLRAKPQRFPQSALSPKQQAFAARVHKAGGHCYTVESVDALKSALHSLQQAMRESMHDH